MYVQFELCAVAGRMGLLKALGVGVSHMDGKKVVHIVVALVRVQGGHVGHLPMLCERIYCWP